MATRNGARRVTSYAAGGLSLLAALALIAVAGGITLGAGGLLAAAAVSAVAAALVALESAGRLTAARHLRRHGLTAEAAIVSLAERYVSVPSGFQGWVTTVRLSFTDITGQLVNAEYTDHARAGGKRAGQTIHITYDPAQPYSVAPAGDDPRVFDAFLLALGSAVLLGFGIYCAVHALG
jgi:Protein of unknown function (DUF3592)